MTHIKSETKSAEEIFGSKEATKNLNLLKGKSHLRIYATVCVSKPKKKDEAQNETKKAEMVITW
jgi:predicted house-cleaning NTP pyrophosphatase (Maf/HAM1 superfamily)